MWDKLFELRRAVDQLVTGLSSTNVVHFDEKEVMQFRNAFQAAVRKGEPFISKSVYEPARRVVKIVGDIFFNVDQQEKLNERRAEKLDPQTDEKIAGDILKLEKENIAALKDVERLFQDVSHAIKDRVMPS